MIRKQHLGKVARLALPDYIRTEKTRRFRSSDSEVRSEGMRLLILPVCLVLLFGVLLFRIVHLQIVQGSYYRNLSDSNRIRTTTIHAPRGVVFDRNHIPLVFNVPGFRKVEKDRTVIIPREEAMQSLAKGEKGIETVSLREYPQKELFAHGIGYIGQLSYEEYTKRKDQGYLLTDWIGKTGIEQAFETTLRGTAGKQLSEVDAHGKEVRTLGKTDPIAGKDLTLTLDSKLQEVAYKALPDDKRGVVIIATPQGEILALVSKPSFDPNLFTQDVSYKASSQSPYQSVEGIVMDNIQQPLLNRAIAGLYAPGSTFKLITAAAGLEKKVIDESFTVEDTGVLRIGEFSFANWFFTQYGKTDGTIDVVKAIKRSNDIFFYKVGEKVGVDAISAVASQFGVGKTLGIDIAGEEKGLLPTSVWKEKTRKEKWYLGDDYHYAIGQGYLLVTPLQVNAWTQVFANGGILYKQHLVKNDTTEILTPNFLSQKTVSLVRQGMIGSCQPTGVAWPLFGFRVKNSALRIDGRNILEAPQATQSGEVKDYRQIVIACKTGTAEHGREKTVPHAWITLFAPAYDPEIVITVLVEESGEGSNVAAPIARKILEEWFRRK